MNVLCTYASAKSDPCDTRESMNLIHCRTSLSKIIHQRFRKRSEETNELKKHSFAIRFLFMCCVRFVDLDEVSVAVDRQNDHISLNLFLSKGESSRFPYSQPDIHCCKRRRSIYSLLQTKTKSGFAATSLPSGFSVSGSLLSGSRSCLIHSNAESCASQI